MLLYVSWRNKYAIIEWLLFDAPTSIHGVFTSFSISQYCCLHFWKNKDGSMLVQGFVRVKSQAKITKYYFLWVGAINLYSLSGRHLMRQKVLIAFLLLLVPMVCVPLPTFFAVFRRWRTKLMRRENGTKLKNLTFDLNLLLAPTRAHQIFICICFLVVSLFM